MESLVERKPPLRFGERMRREYKYDGFMSIIVEGKQRIGKSSYVSQSGAEALGEWDKDGDMLYCAKADYESLKKYIVFRPVDFLNLVLHIEEKVCLVIWDDAGYWLFALDWYLPFVKSVSRYIQLAGRQITCLCLTTPDQDLISSKVLVSLPSMYLGRIRRDERTKDRPMDRPRAAKVYERWKYPDGHPGGVYTRWIDHFNAILPDDFYSWYKPISDQYLDVALRLMRTEVKKLTKTLGAGEAAQAQEDAYKMAGAPERYNELEDVIKNLEADKNEDL